MIYKKAEELIRYCSDANDRTLIKVHWEAFDKELQSLNDLGAELKQKCIIDKGVKL